MSARVHAEAKPSSTPVAGFKTERSDLLRKPEIEQAETETLTPEEALARTMDQPSPPPPGPPAEPPPVGHWFGQIRIGAVSRPLVQPKLRIGQPNDKYEQEADRVAEQVMRIPTAKVEQKKSLAGETKNPGIIRPKLVDQITPLMQRQVPLAKDKVFKSIEPKSVSGFMNLPLQRKCTQCEDKKAESDQKLIQTARQASHQSISSDNNHPLAFEQSAGIPLGNRQFFESRMGTDFSNVRVHTDPKSIQQANQLAARAFTYGNHISFNRGEYNPFSSNGQRLIAHELVHTLQQGTNQASPYIQRKCGDAGCVSVDPDTPECPHPEDFLNNPTLKAIRDSVFEGPSNLSILKRGDTGSGPHL
ncbi:MAG: DUF4157 domain-containing protein, partial [Leptolyngbya sp. SIO4C1]|nr:DUF4157 domain-containing protein [Leptolyngbya sp. SIO4C1]